MTIGFVKNELTTTGEAARAREKGGVKYGRLRRAPSLFPGVFLDSVCFFSARSLLLPLNHNSFGPGEMVAVGRDVTRDWSASGRGR
jgi:hypothetical protein